MQLDGCALIAVSFCTTCHNDRLGLCVTVTAMVTARSRHDLTVENCHGKSVTVIDLRGRLTAAAIIFPVAKPGSGVVVVTANKCHHPGRKG